MGILAGRPRRPYRRVGLSRVDGSSEGDKRTDANPLAGVSFCRSELENPVDFRLDRSGHPVAVSEGIATVRGCDFISRYMVYPSGFTCRTPFLDSDGRSRGPRSRSSKTFHRTNSGVTDLHSGRRSGIEVRRIDVAPRAEKPPRVGRTRLAFWSRSGAGVRGIRYTGWRCIESLADRRREFSTSGHLRSGSRNGVGRGLAVRVADGRPNRSIGRRDAGRSFRLWNRGIR